MTAATYLKTLKLPTFPRECHKLARLCATEGIDHVGYLTRLAEREMIERDRRKVERRIKAAKFAVVKSLDSFDFTAIPKLKWPVFTPTLTDCREPTSGKTNQISRCSPFHSTP